MPWRGKLLLIGGISVGIAALGLLVRDGRVLVLAIPFLLYTGVLLFADLASRSPRLTIRRTLDVDRIEEGGVIHVTVTVKNHGQTIPMLGLVEQLPQSCPVTDGETTCLCPLQSGEEISLRYSLQAPRGVYTFPDAEAIAWDWLSVTSWRLSLPAATLFHVLPRVEPLETIVIRPRRTRAFAGVVKANVGGSGLDFFGCREYIPGDDIRRINWRAFARWNELVVNEYEQERIADVTVILDARERVNMRIGAEYVFDHAVRAAASLALHFLAAGNYVGLLVYGNYLNWTIPGAGRAQRERILDALIRAKTADKAVFEDLGNIPARLFPPRSQLVLISPLADEQDVEILGILRAREYQIMLVTPNTLSSKQAQRPSDGHLALAVRIARLKRSLLLDTLRRIGVQVIDWDISEPLAARMRWAQPAWRRKWV